MRVMTDDAAPIDEALDAISDDPGGVAYDDALPPEDTGDGGRGNGPAYDSPKKMTERGIATPTTTPVGMTQLRTHVLGNWGGASLGILARPPRSVRGPSDMPSLHNWGMAFDWQWKKPGPGRRGTDELIAWCITHANDLGIQAVHDYEQCRYWKSYGKRDGWNEATNSADTGFGQPWATWLHIERTWAAANDDRSIDTSLGASPSAPKVAPDTVPLPTTELKLGDRGAAVARMQDFLRMFGFAVFTRSDGQFGARTQTAVKAAQTAFAAKGLYTKTIDGRWGSMTSQAAERYLSGS